MQSSFFSSSECLLNLTTLSCPSLNKTDKPFSSKKKRKGLLLTLRRKLEKVREISQKPRKKALAESIRKLKIAIRAYESHYDKNIDEENNSDDRIRWKTECENVLQEADEVWFPAEDLLDALESVKEEPEVTKFKESEQQNNDFVEKVEHLDVVNNSESDTPFK